MTIQIISYLRSCEYGRAIMSYLVLGNQWEPRKSVRLTDLEKKDVEIKSADRITNVDTSVGDFATIYGKCKAAVEDIYGTKALTQEHIAAVNTLFIQVSKDKYFKERNSE